LELSGFGGETRERAQKKRLTKGKTRSRQPLDENLSVVVKNSKATKLECRGEVEVRIGGCGEGEIMSARYG